MISNRFLGKLCLSLIFVFAAFGKYQDLDGQVAYTKNGFKNVNLDLSTYGLNPDVVIPYLVMAAAVLEAAGALAVLTGGENCGTIMLMLVLVPTTAIMHWPLNASGAVVFPELISLLKNVAILGGLMIIRNSMRFTPRKQHQD